MLDYYYYYCFMTRRTRTRLDDATIEMTKMQVRERDPYGFNMCKATNVLICGASRSGKTTMFKILADPAYCPDSTSGLFSDTVEMLSST